MKSPNGSSTSTSVCSDELSSGSQRSEAFSRSKYTYGLLAVVGIIVIALAVGGSYLILKWQDDGTKSDDEFNETESRGEVESDSCIQEGNVGGSDLNGGSCCSGLTEVPNCVDRGSGRGCACITDGSFVCTNCGDEICGVGETPCTCPEDCGQPEGVDTEKHWIPLSFILHEGLSDQDYEFSTEIPAGAELVESDDYPDHVLIDGGDLGYSFEFMVPPEAYFTKLSSAEYVLDHPQFDRVFRVEVSGTTDTYMYSTNVVLSGTCDVFGETVEAPCGVSVVTSKTDPEIFFRATCRTDTEDYVICEQILEELSVHISE